MGFLQKLPPWVRCTCCRHRRSTGSSSAAADEQLPQQQQQRNQHEQLEREGGVGVFAASPRPETKEGKIAQAGNKRGDDNARHTPDPLQQQVVLGTGEGMSPFTVAVITCPMPPYEEDLQLQGQYSPLPPSPAAMQQLQIPSQQAPSQRNLLREEAGEIGSKGALDSFSPTFATELLADIELDGDTGTPTAAAAAAVAASAAAGANSLLHIDVPVQQPSAPRP
ncbi:hypothetical protein, conserved [Eimeria praecox]|uniref:Uncharacterized protein n=1 Tax=Eimeria praecox TaxID=51316 RepID=U6GE47_9EIME|nr:hypothetical protein, conserved [Eimeria praecox]